MATLDQLREVLPTDEADDEWMTPEAIADATTLDRDQVEAAITEGKRLGVIDMARDEAGTNIYRWRSQGSPNASKSRAGTDPSTGTNASASGDPGTVLVELRGDADGAIAVLEDVLEPGMAIGPCGMCDRMALRVGRSAVHVAEGLDDDHAAELKRVRPAGPKTGTCTRCNQPMHKVARSWYHDDASLDTDHTATSRVRRKATDKKFAPGELSGAILDWLRQQSEDEDFTPGQIGQAVGCAASSASYSLNHLAGTGEVVMSQSSPQKFRAA